MTETRRLREVIRHARLEIDALDLELLRLLSARARHADAIGSAKRELGEPVRQREREQEVLERVIEANQGPLDDDAIRRLFERILDEARRLERS